jgi:hypothetical protein
MPFLPLCLPLGFGDEQQAEQLENLTRHAVLDRQITKQIVLSVLLHFYGYNLFHLDAN